MLSAFAIVLIVRLALFIIEIGMISFSYGTNNKVIIQLLVWYMNELLLASMFLIDYLYRACKGRKFSISGSSARALIAYVFVTSCYGVMFYWDLAVTNDTDVRMNIWYMVVGTFNALALVMLILTVMMKRAAWFQKTEYQKQMDTFHDSDPTSGS